LSGIDEYARKQVMITNLLRSLQDLHKEKHVIQEELFRIEKQIEKHAAFLKILKNEPD